MREYPLEFETRTSRGQALAMVERFHLRSEHKRKPIVTDEGWRKA